MKARWLGMGPLDIMRNMHFLIELPKIASRLGLLATYMSISLSTQIANANQPAQEERGISVGITIKLIVFELVEKLIKRDGYLVLC